jgi:predicted nucleic acid-binding protein
MVSDGLVAVRFSCEEHLSQMAALAKRYADRTADLADLCLIRMSELHSRHTVITVDRADFRVYRRNKREAIPLLTPPE